MRGGIAAGAAPTIVRPGGLRKVQRPAPVAAASLSSACWVGVAVVGLSLPRSRVLKSSPATAPPRKSAAKKIQIFAGVESFIRVIPTATAGLNAPPEIEPTA